MIVAVSIGLGMGGYHWIVGFASHNLNYLYDLTSGRRVRMRTKLLAVEPKGGGLQVKSENTIEIEGEAKPACIAETITLYFPAA